MHSPLSFRISGILQRIGLCYIINSILYLLFENLFYYGAIILAFMTIYAGFMYGYNVPDYTNPFT